MMDRMGERVEVPEYVDAIRAAFPPQIDLPRPSSNGNVFRVESGVVLAAALVGDSCDSFAPVLLGEGGGNVIDGAGRGRPHYAGLMCYCWARALEIVRPQSPESRATAWENALHRWCSELNTRLSFPSRQTGVVPAGSGGALTADAWNALALAAAWRVKRVFGWRDAADDVFARLVRYQRPDGPFLRMSASDNPETHWFHELVLLHAAASYAALTGDPAATAAVARHAEWVREETQPDHATNEPWGLHAFAQNAETRSLADGSLHAVRILHPAGATGVSLMLLADALYCLRPPTTSDGGST
jgi:hypothetical protein